MSDFEIEQTHRQSVPSAVGPSLTLVGAGILASADVGQKSFGMSGQSESSEMSASVGTNDKDSIINPEAVVDGIGVAGFVLFLAGIVKTAHSLRRTK